jgi:hypothetical protein
MRRDLMNNINPIIAIPPAAAVTDNTPFVSSIIDTAGYESLTLVFVTGTETDVDALFTLTMEHGDQSNLSDTAAPASTDLIGTLALASFTFSDDNKTRKIGYIGGKRYVRATVTPTNNAAGNIFLAATAVLGHPHNAPTSNPPA